MRRVSQAFQGKKAKQAEWRVIAESGNLIGIKGLAWAGISARFFCPTFFCPTGVILIEPSLHGRTRRRRSCQRIFCIGVTRYLAGDFLARSLYPIVGVTVFERELGPGFVLFLCRLRALFLP